jgi:hypothetical protein
MTAIIKTLEPLKLVVGVCTAPHTISAITADQGAIDSTVALAAMLSFQPDPKFVHTVNLAVHARRFPPAPLQLTHCFRCLVIEMYQPTTMDAAPVTANAAEFPSPTAPTATISTAVINPTDVGDLQPTTDAAPFATTVLGPVVSPIPSQEVDSATSGGDDKVYVPDVGWVTMQVTFRIAQPRTIQYARTHTRVYMVVC